MTNVSKKNQMMTILLVLTLVFSVAHLALSAVKVIPPQVQALYPAQAEEDEVTDKQEGEEGGDVIIAAGVKSQNIVLEEKTGPSFVEWVIAAWNCLKVLLPIVLLIATYLLLLADKKEIAMVLAVLMLVINLAAGFSLLNVNNLCRSLFNVALPFVIIALSVNPVNFRNCLVYLIAAAVLCLVCLVPLFFGAFSVLNLFLCLTMCAAVLSYFFTFFQQAEKPVTQKA